MRGHLTGISTVSREASRFVSSFSLFEGQPDVIIYDLPKSSIKKSRIIFESGAFKIGLDHFGENIFDLVISVFEHCKKHLTGDRLSGLEYSIIRPEIRALQDFYSHTDGVLIAMGAGDLRGFGPQIARDLSKKGVKVTIIEGPLVKNGYSDLINDPNIEVVRNPSNIGELMSQCEWAVSNGGGTMLELLCLGKAVVSMPQTKMENQLATFIKQRGGLIAVGKVSSTNPRKYELRRIGKQAGKLVDGRGLERIVALIEMKLCP